MKTLKSTAIIGFSLTIAAPALSLNGLRPIATTAETRAMGGTGVATPSTSYAAVYKNPSLLPFINQAPDSFDLTIGLGMGSFKSRAKGNRGRYTSDWLEPEGGGTAVFPSGIGAGYHYDQSLSFGFGTFGGGGGADYGDADPVLGARSEVVAFSGVLASGLKLSDKFSLGMALWATAVTIDASSLSWTGNGMRNDTGGEALTYGVSLGSTYQVDPQLTIGTYLQPPQTAVIKDGRDYAEEEGRPFGDPDDVLFTGVPFEAAIGFHYHATPSLEVATDLRFLRWSEAEFLRQLGWEDQATIAIGLAYGLDPQKTNILRIGYNYGNAPAQSVAQEEGQDRIALQGHPFPKVAASAISGISAFGTTQHHVTLGSSHVLSDRMSLDTSLTHMVKSSITRNGDSYNISKDPPTDPYGWTGEFEATLIQTELNILF